VSAILGIDPGTTQSAWVFLEDHHLPAFGIEPNERVLDVLDTYALVGSIAIERIEPRYGLRMGWETIETCEWVGRFVQAAHPVPATLLRRSDILRHLGVASKGSADSGVRAALLDRWGGLSSCRKGGPLYGVKTHIWSALSVAVAYREGVR
jgi:hypothetical protein